MTAAFENACEQESPWPPQTLERVLLRITVPEFVDKHVCQVLSQFSVYPRESLMYLTYVLLSTAVVAETVPTRTLITKGAFRVIMDTLLVRTRRKKQIHAVVLWIGSVIQLMEKRRGRTWRCSRLRQIIDTNTVFKNGLTSISDFLRPNTLSQVFSAS